MRVIEGRCRMEGERERHTVTLGPSRHIGAQGRCCKATPQSVSQALKLSQAAEGLRDDASEAIVAEKAAEQKSEKRRRGGSRVRWKQGGMKDTHTAECLHPASCNA